MKTPRKKVPVVNFTDNCVTFKDLLDRLEIPEEFQYKGEFLENLYRLTQKQIKGTLKNMEFLQEGKIIESDEEYLSYPQNTYAFNKKHVHLFGKRWTCFLTIIY